MIIRGYDVEVARLVERLGGGFVAYVPALKGCVADGATADEALDNLQDAIHCWLETARAKGRPIPPSITAPHAGPGAGSFRRASRAPLDGVRSSSGASEESRPLDDYDNTILTTLM